MDRIRQRMKQAAVNSNRQEHEIQLLLATKTVAAEAIKEALLHGSTLIGENKVQELKEKFSALQDIPHQTHFIGYLQTNKIKEVLKYASCIQSVDRLNLAEKIDSQLQKEGRSIDIMLQVNTSRESSKFGVAPEELLTFAGEVSRYDTLQVKGLMTIGLFSGEDEKVRHCFKLLKEKQAQLDALDLPNCSAKELSMGMSSDLEIAIEEGATIIRVGTAVFGNRSYPDSYYWNENKSIQ